MERDKIHLSYLEYENGFSKIMVVCTRRLRRGKLKATIYKEGVTCKKCLSIIRRKRY
jgi:hypothetical protein